MINGETILERYPVGLAGSNGAWVVPDGDGLRVYVVLPNTVVTLGVQLTEGCPMIKVHTPVFDYDEGVYPVRSSGLVVVDGLTELTWKGGDVIELLKNALSRNVPSFTPGTSYPCCNTVELDYSVLSYVTSDLKQGRVSLKKSMVGNTATGPELGYVLIQSTLGLKTVCEVVSISPTEGEVIVSGDVLPNLHIGDLDAVTFKMLHPPVCESIELRQITGKSYSKADTDQLNDYHVVTIGDVLTLKSGKFLVAGLEPSNVALLASHNSGVGIRVNYA